MNPPSRPDLTEMRAMVTRLERVIADATATIAELKAAIAAAEAQPTAATEATAGPATALTVVSPTPAAPGLRAPARAPRPTPWSKRRQPATNPATPEHLSASATSSAAPQPPPRKTSPRPLPADPPTAIAAAGQAPSALDALPESLRSLRVPTVARSHPGAGPAPGARPAPSPGADHHPPSTPLDAAQPNSAQPTVTKPADAQPATPHPPAAPPAAAPPPPPRPAAAAQPTTTQPDTATRPPATNTPPRQSASDANALVEMAARHGLTVIGLDRAQLDSSSVVEVARAVEYLLGRYPIALQGIEISDPASSAPPRTLGAATRPRSDPAPLWLVLDRTTLMPLPAAAPRSRQWLRTRRRAHSPAYTAVVRAYGAALDVAGDFRARQQAQRLLVAESLRGGADLGFSPLNPGLALVDAFTEVVVRERRAGKQAKALHDILVNIARTEPVSGARQQPMGHGSTGR